MSTKLLFSDSSDANEGNQQELIKSKREISNNSPQNGSSLKDGEISIRDSIQNSISSEYREKINKDTKKSGSTPEMKNSQNVYRDNKNPSNDILKEKKEKIQKREILIKSVSKVISSINQSQNEGGTRTFKDHLDDQDIDVDKPWDSVVHSIVSKVLAHIPLSSSNYQNIAESVVHDILSETLSQMPPDERKFKESVAHSILSEVLNQIPSKDTSLDCEYLKEHLGRPLTLALCEILFKLPVDPIHYLAHWLFKWRWNEQQRQMMDEEINALNLERQRVLAETKEKERLEAEQKAMRELRKIANEEALHTLETAMEKAFIEINNPNQTEHESGKSSHSDPQP